MIALRSLTLSVACVVSLLVFPAATATESTLSLDFHGVSTGASAGSIDITGALCWDAQAKAYAGHILLTQTLGSSSADREYDITMRVAPDVGVTSYRLASLDGTFFLALKGPLDAATVTGTGTAIGVGDLVIAGTAASA